LYYFFGGYSRSVGLLVTGFSDAYVGFLGVYVRFIGVYVRFLSNFMVSSVVLLIFSLVVGNSNQRYNHK
jgi:hypothetical protein